MKTLIIEEKGAADGSEDYTQDGTVDLKGRPVLRSKTGRWKGASFMIGYEVLERIAFHGVASNLFIFFTTKLKYATVDASNTITNWQGTSWLLPIFGGYIADAHLGRYWTFLIGSGFYILGMSLLALVAIKEELLMPKPMCTKEQKDCQPHIFSYRELCLFGALYLIAIGNGGTKPNISSMGAEQFDDLEPKEKKQKLSFFNWWMFSVFFGSFVAATLMVWIQSRLDKGYATGYSIQALLIVLGLVLFLAGTRFYRLKKPNGSAFTKIGRVLVAAFKKRNVKVPENPQELHELSVEEYTSLDIYRIDHTPSLRFLDKAAVKTGADSPWMLCTVTQVEETKQMMKMIPVLLSTIIPSTFLGVVQTLFIKQGTTLDLTIFQDFKLPVSSLKCIVQIFMIASVIPYDRLFVPYMRRLTRNPRGITMLTRMGIGMALFVAIAATAYFAELKRMAVIRESGNYGAEDELPLSFFILIPQFALVGIADTFLQVAKMDFFYDQAPTGMKSLGTSYYSTSMGIGAFLNTFILRTITNLTKSKANPDGWVPRYNLKVGHLDYYYALWILLTFVNFVFFLVVAKLYVYNVDTERSKKIDTEIVEMESLSEDRIVETNADVNKR